MATNTKSKVGLGEKVAVVMGFAVVLAIGAAHVTAASVGIAVVAVAFTLLWMHARA